MLAAVLGAAMNGIEDAEEPPAPISGNAYEMSEEDAPPIPGSLPEAIKALRGSAAAFSRVRRSCR